MERKAAGERKSEVTHPLVHRSHLLSLTQGLFSTLFLIPSSLFPGSLPLTYKCYDFSYLFPKTT